jgi:ribosomal-protein-alanine N-acetyltransferase
MFRNWANDPEVTRFLTWQPHGSIDITRKINQSDVSKYENSSHYQWAVVLKSLVETIGGINVVRIDEPCSCFEIAYRIGKAWWRQGIAIEALSAVIKFLFEQIGANRITASYDTRNQNSSAVMRKCGLRYEGTLRRSGCNNQGIYDAACYAILSEDYFGQRKKEISNVSHKWEYRLAVPSDASELLKLNDLFNGEDCNNLAAIKSSLKNNTQEIVCVAADGEKLRGFCCGQIFKSMCYDVNYGDITELFVIESYRRQGVASDLMSFIESEFQNQGINHFQLFTGGENKIGQAFYKRQGYEPTTEMMFRKRPLNGETKND